MISVTALDLVNEWVDLHRFDPISNFNQPLGRNGLRFINNAITKILNKREWDFAHRHDGVMYTHPFISTDDAKDAAGRGYLLAGTDQTEGILGAAAVLGDDGDVLLEYYGSPWDDFDLNANLAYEGTQPAACPWIQISGDDDLGTASYKLWSVYLITGSIGEAVRIGPAVTGGSNWKGISRATTSVDASGNSNALRYSLFAHEYIMPDSVRSVTEVSVQGEPVDLIPVSDESLSSIMYPDPAEHVGDNLLKFYAGGNTFRYDLPAVEGYTTVAPRALRVALYPTPQTQYMINYSYIYRFPHLSAPTDTLEITEEARDLLVDHAFAKSQLSQVGNDPEMGRIAMAENRRDVHDALAADEPASRERYTVRPYGDGGRGPSNWRWRSQTITGL
jgi:hypothetical protein